jgi:hypothetical protein
VFESGKKRREEKTEKYRELAEESKAWVRHGVGSHGKGDVGTE